MSIQRLVTQKKDVCNNLAVSPHILTRLRMRSLARVPVFNLRISSVLNVEACSIRNEFDKLFEISNARINELNRFFFYFIRNVFFECEAR